MSDAQAQATFQVSVEGNAPDAGRAAAASMRDAYQAITQYESEIKNLSADLRRLRGTTDEVAEAKKKIRERVDMARQSVSTLTADLLRQGSSYAQASAAAQTAAEAEAKAAKLAEAAIAEKAAAAKKAADVEAKAREAASKGGKPSTSKSSPEDPSAKKAAKENADAVKTALGMISPRLQAAHGLFGDLSKVAGDAGGGMQAMRLGGLGAAAGVAAVAAAAVAAVVAVTALTVAMVKFILVSSDAAAKAQRQRQALLGNAQDAQNLGLQIAAVAGKVGAPREEIQQLAVDLARTRLTGKAMVDTLNAVSQASGAAGSSAGEKLKEVITRGQNTGRMFLGMRELQGTGIDFDDVAREYAAGTKKSIAAARAELLQGRAGLEDGAAALRRATEAKFGGMNLEDAFSLENGPQKLKAQIGSLVSGVNIKPISEQFGKLYQMLAPDAPLGGAIKSIAETIGNGFVKAAATGIPYVVEGFKWVVVGGLKLVTAMFEVRNAIRDAIGAKTLEGSGRALVDGLIKGMKSGFGALWTVAKGLGKEVIRGFSTEMEIRSPSRKMQKLAGFTVDGYVDEVERGSARASKATAELVEMPKAAKAPAAGGGSMGGDIIVNIYVEPGDGAKGVQSQSFLEGLTRAIRAARTASAA